MIGHILLAHGARDAQWAAPLRAVAQQLAGRRPGEPVRLAFLEFEAPSLPEAGAELATLGCRAVHVLPLFLGGGGHVRKDVPPMMDALRAAQPHVQWTLHAAAGVAPGVIAALAAWADAASREAAA